MVSTMSCEMMRVRLAPMARRTAISFWRPVARARSRLAILAQAMSRTKPVVAISTHKGVARVRPALRAGENVNPAFEEFLSNESGSLAEGGLLHLHLEHGAHEGLQRGFGLLLRDSGFQAPEGIDPTLAAILEPVFRDVHELALHGYRKEDFGGVAEFDAFKSGLCDPDDGDVVIVDDDILADDGGIGAETRPPVVVAEHR